MALVKIQATKMSADHVIITHGWLWRAMAEAAEMIRTASGKVSHVEVHKSPITGEWIVEILANVEEAEALP